MGKNIKNFGIIILAAGKGTRLNCSDVPKVLCKIGGRPMIEYILETLESNGIPKDQICIVVGYMKEKIIKALGKGYIYAVQAEQLGTAHAALIGEKTLPEKYEHLLVMNGDDSAFYKFDTLKEFTGKHLRENNDITILTAEIDYPSGLGRVIRDKNGKLLEMREKENLKSGDKNIKEINTGTYCLKRSWFAEMCAKLKPIKNLGEYGLPGLVEIAMRTNSKIGDSKLGNSAEWYGINTKNELDSADRIKKAIDFYEHTYKKIDGYFDCGNCDGSCCIKAGAVVLYPGESEYLSTIITDFKESVVVREVGGTEIELFNLPCPFHVNGRCSLGTKRPLDCRFYPYDWCMNHGKAEIFFSKNCRVAELETDKNGELNNLLVNLLSNFKPEWLKAASLFGPCGTCPRRTSQDCEFWEPAGYNMEEW